MVVWFNFLKRKPHRPLVPSMGPASLKGFELWAPVLKVAYSGAVMVVQGFTKCREITVTDIIMVRYSEYGSSTK